MSDRAKPDNNRYFLKQGARAPTVRGLSAARGRGGSVPEGGTVYVTPPDTPRDAPDFRLFARICFAIKECGKKKSIQL